MRKPYRVAVVGPGGLGLCAIREIRRLADLELVGVLAYSADKDGCDAGELAGIGPIGVKTTTDLQSFLDLDADCVLYTGRDFGDWRSDNDILALLEAGKNVVTPLPYHYLPARGADIEARFKAAAAKGRSTLHGSGITPGFFNERLAMLMTGLSNDVTHIRFQEFFNVEPLGGALQTLQLFGFGASKEAAEQNVAVAMMAENYLRQPILFAADKLGVAIDRIERRPQLKTTPVAIVTPAMTIEPGTVGLVSYVWTAYSRGKPFYTTEVYYYLGASMRPDGAQGDDFWTIEIEGRPSLRVTVGSQASYQQDLVMRVDEPTPPGYLATVITLVQAIPAVVGAPPGLLLPAMPQFHWKPDGRA